MSASFNAHIFVDKLTKLNNSQQSIETLSHWCIFHRNKAKQVVETWERQFYCSARDQRVSFLYLANDILQNSRRKGLEFVGEFWKVLPDALNDVIENGDEFGKNAASRLVDIWEERKVFGSRGQILKEELMGRNPNNKNRNGKTISYKLKQPTGDMLERLVSCYEHVCNGPEDEDALFGKCQNAISFTEKLEMEIGNDLNSGNINGSGVEELQGQHNILRECVEQLKAAESSRLALSSQLREALHEQESKIDQIRNQLKVAQLRFDQVGNICQQLLDSSTRQLQLESRLHEATQPSDASPSYTSEAQASTGDKSQSTPVSHTPPGHSEEEQRKTAAAAMAAQLTASSTSAQMLTYVLSSLASEGAMCQSANEDYPSDGKRPKLDNGVPPYNPSQPPPPPFPHPDSLQQPPPPSSPVPNASSPSMQPPPPPMPAALAPLPPLPLPMATQFIPPMTEMPYNYNLPPLIHRTLPPPLMNYPMPGMSTGYPSPPMPNPFYNFQGPEGVHQFGQPPLPPISRQ